MCIFCGGTCGGAGDAILPYVTIGATLVIMKVQSKRASRKQKHLEEISEKTGDPGNKSDTD